MRKLYPVLFLTLLGCLLLQREAKAQTTITTTNGTLTSLSAASCGISFVVENTNAYDVLLTDLSMYRNTATNAPTLSLWYSSTSITGAISLAAPTWTQITTASPGTVAANGVYPVFTGIGFNIPANTTYRFVVQSNVRVDYGSSTTVGGNTFSGGGVNIRTGNYQISGVNVGYSGNTGTPLSLATTPRFFVGTVTVLPAVACVNPPTPGTATSSVSSAVCTGTNVGLSLTSGSYSSGLSQTFEWESSPTDVPFTPTSISAPATSPTLNINPSVTLWYRCKLVCSGGTPVYSTPVQVLVTPPFPAGTYTINAGQPTTGTNYHSFADALTAMNCGIGGPIVFNVAPNSGPYNEQLSISPVAGASATNTITFNGNGNTIQVATPVTANRHVIKLNGADYFTLNNLVIATTDASTSAYGWGVHLTGGADYNTISNCTINIASLSTTQSNSAGIVVANSTSSVTTDGSASYNKIINNTISGAYQGIILTGTATSTNCVKNIVSGNTVKDFYADGISLTDNDSCVIANNNILRATRVTVTTFAGIQIGANCIKTVINANKIHDTHNAATTQSGAAYGIYFTGCDAPAGAENRATNNLIYNFNSATGAQYGIYNSSSNGAYYYHNTISLDNVASTAGVTRGFYQTTSASNIDFRNNVISITRGGTGIKYCVYYNTDVSAITSNKNDLYISSAAGTNGVGYFDGGGGFTTLANWQTANTNAYDQASFSTDPVFAGPAIGNFTPTTSAIDDQGIPLGVTTDLIGQPRSATTPDIGAYEYAVGACSGNPVAGTVSGPSNACPGTNVPLSLSNFSTGGGITIQWEQSLPGTGNWQPIAGATNSNYTVTAFNASMDYHAVVTCTIGGGNDISNTVSVTLNPFFSCYCTPVITTTGASILNVNIPGTTLDNTTTAAAAPFYVQYPASGSTTASLAQAGTYTMNLTLSTSGISSMWIDYDHSGTYEASEWTQIATSGTAHSATFTIPQSAMLGLTGMRIRTRSSGANAGGNPCTSMTLAETEDYLITIDPIQACTGMPTPGVASGPSGGQCSPATINLNVTGYTVATGISLQWESYNANQSSWSPIPGATDAMYAATNVIASTDYRVAVTCAGGGTAYSNTVSSTIFNPQLLTTTPGTRCGTGTVTLGATGSAGSIIKWYDAATGGNTLGTGTSFVTPLITTTTDYYATATSGGTNQVSSNGSPTVTTSTQNGGLQFTLFQSVILNSIDVFSTSAGTATVVLQNSAGTVLYTSPAMPIVAANLSTPQTLSLGWSIPAGTGYRILVSNTGNALGYATGAFPAPMGNGVGTITNGWLNTASSTLNYFVYNMNTTSGCESARTAVTATVNPAAAIVATAAPDDTVCLGSQAMLGVTTGGTGYNYTWNPGGLTGANVSVTPSANTTYYLSAIDGSGCTAYDTIDIVVKSAAASVATVAASTQLCVNGTASLSLNPTPAFGIEYQWQKNTGSGFTDIAGATNATFSETVATSASYQAKLFCSGNLAVTSSPVAITINNPAVPNTFPGSRCGPGPVTLAATSAAGTTLKWYTTSTGGTPVGTGGAYTTPSITSTTDFYVAAISGSGIVSTGLPTIPASPTSGSGTTNFGLLFDALTPFTLQSVVVYPISASSASGTITVDVLNGSGVVVHTATFNVTGAPTSAPVPQTLNLNFNIAAGTNYKIRPGMSGISGILFGPTASAPTGGNYGYPFVVPGVLSINSSTNTAANTPRLDLYYYFFNWQVSTGCESVRVPVTATINAAASGTGLSTGGTVAGAVQADGTTVDYVDGCNDKVASVTDAAGGNTMGATSAVVLTSSTVQTFNGAPYVPRVYDVTPTSSGSATMTLYVLQSEFNAYNNYVTTNNLSDPLLPTGPSDAAGIANIAITQYHGSASAGTSGPGGLYNVNQKELIPNSSITKSWNGTYWTLTFPVSGFSGFFIHSGTGPLSIKMGAISATNAGNRNRVDWNTAAEARGDYFTVERSTDGRNFTALGNVTAKGAASVYSYWDDYPAAGVNYYRLKLMGTNGSISYSKVVSAIMSGVGSFSIEAYPNPVSEQLTVKVHGVIDGDATITIMDATGKEVKRQPVKGTEVKIEMGGLSQGMYLIRYNDASQTQLLKLNKQ